MKKDDNKKNKELFIQAGKVIKSLGYKPNLDMLYERPDFVLPSNKDRQIGIEVTEYIRNDLVKNEDSIYKILRQYTKRLDKKTDKRYLIYVDSQFEKLSTNLHFNNIKEVIFNEIDSFIFPNNSTKLKYIENVNISEVPGMGESFASLDAQAFVYGETNEQLLLDCIRKKEMKLKEYKSSPDNQTIREYYLVIYASILEHPEVRDYNLPDGFKSDYDRIYFVDDFEMKQLK
jgi:hypothetical protein